jgi:hypothetical protein
MGQLTLVVPLHESAPSRSVLEIENEWSNALIRFNFVAAQSGHEMLKIVGVIDRRPELSAQPLPTVPDVICRADDYQKVRVD